MIVSVTLVMVNDENGTERPRSSTVESRTVFSEFIDSLVPLDTYLPIHPFELDYLRYSPFL